MSSKCVMKQVGLLAGLLASSFFLTATLASAADATHKSAAEANAARKNWSAHNSEYYKRTWGIDIAGVKLISSNYMLEFRYRVLDPNKAKILGDKSVKAYLKDEASGVTLSVPTLEKVGEVRQAGKAEANHVYFMVFGNPSKIVKPGNRVSIVVGKFRADGIIVQ